jgi:hypothetical protein
LWNKQRIFETSLAFSKASFTLSIPKRGMQVPILAILVSSDTNLAALLDEIIAIEAF